MNEEKKQTLTYEKLSISGFELLHLQELFIIQQIGEHTSLFFTGILQEEKEEPLDTIIFSSQAGKSVEVYYQIEGKEEQRCLFRGVLTNVSIENEREHKILKANAWSNTYWLDQYQKSRSFQNTSVSYRALFDQVLADTQKAEMSYMESAQEQIGEIVVQYLETDWQFLKRMASRFHVGLIPIMDNAFPKIYYGVAKQEQAEEIPVIAYSMKKDIRAYQLDSSNGVPDIHENDYITYEVLSTAIFHVGEAVKFKGVIFYIKRAIYEMKNGVLRSTYEIGSKNSLKQRTQYNEQIKGISLNGTVAGVSRDKVSVNLQIDGYRGACYYFPYSTISASPDGSGWYCMPEIGDEVRIYFPDREEKNCYAISSVSGYVPKDGDTDDRMSDPSVKYLRTAANQEIVLDDNGITINSSDGKAVIAMDKSGNISIMGQKSVTVDATESLKFLGKEIIVNAKESIILKGAEAKFTMDSSGNTKLEGSYVLEN